MTSLSTLSSFMGLVGALFSAYVSLQYIVAKKFSISYPPWRLEVVDVGGGGGSEVAGVEGHVCLYSGSLGHISVVIFLIQLTAA
jgi:hypothetical protein